MLTTSLLFEDYVTRRQVGSGIGRTAGSGLGALIGGIGGAIGMGMLAHGMSNGDPNAMRNILLPGAILVSAGGGLLGNVIGSRIGSNVISNPNDPADFSKTSHRVGYINDEGMKIQLRDIFSPYNRRSRQANALRKMGYDDIAINAAVNPGYNPNGVPNATPFDVALTNPTKPVANK